MPDLERVADELRYALARAPEARAYADGFRDGRRWARLESATVLVFLVVVGGLIWIFKG